MGSIDTVSVIIPAYNATATIAQSIRSALAVGDELVGTALEIVVVDDGSTDGTAELVRETFGADSRVRLHGHRRNRGGGAARNTAVEHARSEWMFCLDADNVIDAASFLQMLEMASTGTWDVVSPAETRYFESSIHRSTWSWHWDRVALTIDDVLRVYETPVASGNYLFTLDIWQRAGGYPEFAGSLDAWGFGVRALFEGARFGVCDGTFYHHRQGHESYYIRDRDDRRAIAAAQILLPYVDRLVTEDRVRLLGGGEILQCFAELPARPLRLAGATFEPPAARVVPVRREPATNADRGWIARTRSFARCSWSELPPAATIRRVGRLVGTGQRRVDH